MKAAKHEYLAYKTTSFGKTSSKLVTASASGPNRGNNDVGRFEECNHQEIDTSMICLAVFETRKTQYIQRTLFFPATDLLSYYDLLPVHTSMVHIVLHIKTF